MKKEGKKWMLVALALLAVVTVTLPLVGCKNDTVAEQTGDDPGSGDGNQGTGDDPGTGDGNQGTGDGTGSGSGNQGTGDGTGSGDGNQGTGDGTGSGSGNQGSGDPEQPVTYTVTFDANNGTGSIDSQPIVSGQTATKPADPTLENNVFGGWYSDEELTSEYDFTTPVTGSFTLYAKWVKRIEVNADYVSFGIAELTGDGSYILVATGEWSSDDLSKLANELKDESKKVNLDLSKATGLTTIGVLAFDGCDSLTSISIPEGVKSIGDCAFQDCSGLTSISIPSSVEIIGGAAFRGCSSLTSISIPSSVEFIWDLAFSGCSSLTSISIPSSVEIIRGAAFQGCSELTTVTMKATTPPELGSNAFSNTSTGLQILVPSGSEEAYWEAENWKEYSGKIKAIPDQTS